MTDKSIEAQLISLNYQLSATTEPLPIDEYELISHGLRRLQATIDRRQGKRIVPTSHQEPFLTIEEQGTRRFHEQAQKYLTELELEIENEKE